MLLGMKSLMFLLLVNMFLIELHIRCKQNRCVCVHVYANFNHTFSLSVYREASLTTVPYSAEGCHIDSMVHMHTHSALHSKLYIYIYIYMRQVMVTFSVSLVVISFWGWG